LCVGQVASEALPGSEAETPETPLASLELQHSQVEVNHSIAIGNGASAPSAAVARYQRI
jgi:hypothetical protein